MRPNLQHLKAVTTADFLDSMAAKESSSGATRLREETIRNLSRAPFVSIRVHMTTFRMIEALALALAALLVAALHPGLHFAAKSGYYLPLIATATIAFPIIAQALGFYTIHNLLRPLQCAASLTAVWTVIFGAIAVGMFMSKIGENYSRIWLVGWYIGGIAALLFVRALGSMITRRWNKDGRFNRHAVLVGGGAPACDLLAALETARASDISIVGVFDDRNDERSPPQIRNLHKLGTTAELVDFVRQARIDLLLVTIPVAAEERLLHVLKRLWVLPVDIRLSAYTQKFHYRPRAYSYIGNVPFLDVFDKPLRDWDVIVKSIEDRLLAAIALLLLSPVMLLTALAIKLDSKGPVLFRQKRFGFNNELIEVFKFRSMYSEMTDADAVKLVSKGDPRITRVGAFIRKTSLDELPQLFNVLRGELSLVGPRPHATKAKAADMLYNDVVDGYFARHKVKPGITGWAQINGWRGETDTALKLRRRVEHDLYYIENWSLAFDLYILFKTPVSLLQTENAY